MAWFGLVRLGGVLREPTLALWAMCMLLMPLYAWRSGRPQPADLVSLLFIPLLREATINAVPRYLRQVLSALVTFAGYAAVVNLIWGVLLLDYDVRKVGALGFASFYLFNAYMFALCIYLFAAFRMRFVAVTIWSTAIAVGLQVLLYAIRGPSTGFRETLLFNNANQLGYYALLSATLIAFGFRAARMPVIVAGAAVASCVFLAALSLSKAAMMGTVIVAAVGAIRRPMLLAVVALVLVAGASLRDPTNLFDRVQRRIDDMGSSYDDTPEGRGYSRIPENPQYLVLGAGEVGFDRHNRDIAGELHSSVGTLIFSYGVIGTVFFSMFLWRALRPVRRLDLLFFVPILAYGTTHQGLRFRLFWILVAIACLISMEARASEARRRGGRPMPITA
ncbi:MAG: hypothetical protein A2138_06085 [Deltaproteobacteria bacterium RBG_16_71_12]|nr:MAG: hypothetical protein A2138_06085 [Deltaproteobacteria bacterium RBG_16_71_12]